jgi:uncharacterized membrane protein
MTAVVWLVAGLLFSGAVAIVTAILTAVIVVTLWFALPVSRRFSHGN